MFDRFCTSSICFLVIFFSLSMSSLLKFSSTIFLWSVSG